MDTNKVVLVTGCARRLGAAIVRELHGRGWQVLLHCNRSRLEAEELASLLNSARANSAQVLVADLADMAALRKLAADALQRWGRLDALINNASSFYPTPLGEATLEQWQDLFASNARAPFFLTQALLPALREARGSVINMVDIHASRPLPQHSIYCMAKASLVMLTKALARELAPEVRVNAIAPGAMLWPEGMDAATQEKIMANIPLQRLGSPEDIARTAAFLLMDASYITGQIIAVDGGRGI